MSMQGSAGGFLRDSPRRRDRDQEIARFEDENDCQRARKALSRQNRAAPSRGIGRIECFIG
jgi:hypothetical protein